MAAQVGFAAVLAITQYAQPSESPVEAAAIVPHCRHAAFLASQIGSFPCWMQPPVLPLLKGICTDGRLRRHLLHSSFGSHPANAVSWTAINSTRKTPSATAKAIEYTGFI